jgi:hypothetical protein
MCQGDSVPQSVGSLKKKRCMFDNICSNNKKDYQTSRCVVKLHKPDTLISHQLQVYRVLSSDADTQCM